MIGGSKIADLSPGRPIEAPSDRHPAQDTQYPNNNWIRMLANEFAIPDQNLLMSKFAAESCSPRVNSNPLLAQHLRLNGLGLYDYEVKMRAIDSYRIDYKLLKGKYVKDVTPVLPLNILVP
nr:hypothetical protein Itr_chr03CG09980 [Ipomoea trifida]